LSAMYLYPLGRVPWQESQLAYHALASLGRESLVLCSPARPYVSVGYFQDPSQELDLEHCRRAGLSDLSSRGGWRLRLSG
jgi:lipoate-protein ligase A